MIWFTLCVRLSLHIPGCKNALREGGWVLDILAGRCDWGKALYLGGRVRIWQCSLDPPHPQRSRELGVTTRSHRISLDVLILAVYKTHLRKQSCSTNQPWMNSAQVKWIASGLNKTRRHILLGLCCIFTFFVHLQHLKNYKFSHNDPNFWLLKNP